MSKDQRLSHIDPVCLDANPELQRVLDDIVRAPNLLDTSHPAISTVAIYPKNLGGASNFVSTAHITTATITTLNVTNINLSGGTPSWAQNALLDGSNHTDTVAGSVTAGDLIRGNSTPKWERLAAGTNGHVLTMSGGLPVWAAASGGSNALLDGSNHTDTTAGTVARADLITGQDASATWKRLAKGTANQILAMDGSATDVVWTDWDGGTHGGDGTPNYTIINIAESAWTQTTGTTEQINLGYTLAAREIVWDIMLEVTTAFSGGNATAANIDVGFSGNASFYIGGVDAFTLGPYPGTHTRFSDLSASTQVMKIQLQTTGFTPPYAPASFTAGNVRVHLWTVQLGT